MDIPKVSVIIPTYNRAHCVGRAIESILNQSFKEVEIIVVDDGSADDTIGVLAKYERQINLIRQQNAGVSAARNAGIRAARGKWVAFLDSDDTWAPQKLTRQVDCLERSGAKVCYASCIADDNEIISNIDGLKPAGATSEIYFQNAIEMIWRLPAHPLIPSLVVEKQLLLRAGMFDESLPAAEDTRLIYNLAFLSGFIYLDEPLVTVFRGSAHSLTYDLKPESAMKRFSAYLRVQMEAYWRLVEISPEHSSVLRQRMAYFISRRAELACAAGQLKQARLIARNGLCLTGDLAPWLRCVGIYLAPGLWQARFRRKWYQNSPGVTGPNSTNPKNK